MNIVEISRKTLPGGQEIVEREYRCECGAILLDRQVSNVGVNMSSVAYGRVDVTVGPTCSLCGEIVGRYSV